MTTHDLNFARKYTPKAVPALKVPPLVSMEVHDRVNGFRGTSFRVIHYIARHLSTRGWHPQDRKVLGVDGIAQRRGLKRSMRLS